MLKKLNVRTGALLSIMLLAAFSRVLPHPDNFTPISAIALFGAAYFSQRHLAVLLPLSAMWLSDLFLNNYIYARMYPSYYDGFIWFGSAWVYASFALITLMGGVIIRKIRPLPILIGSLSASVLFFLVTNFGAWLGNPMYAQDFSGLGASYINGIPFFRNTLLGDLCYSGVLFGTFEWARRKYPALATAKHH